MKETAKIKPEARVRLVRNIIEKSRVTLQNKKIAIFGDTGFLDVALDYANAQDVTFIICDKTERRNAHVVICDKNKVKYYDYDSKDTIFNNMEFDIVMGNPPYNKPRDDSGGSGSRTNLWIDFVELAFKKCKVGGDILFVTPNNWRTGKFPVGELLKERNTPRLNIVRDMMWSNSILHVETNLHNYFKDNANTNPDWWHIRKDGKKATTGHKHLDDRLMWPDDGKLFLIFAKYIEKCFCEDSICAVEDYVSGHFLASAKDEDHAFEYAATSAQLKNNKCKWSCKKLKNYNEEKVIFSASGRLDATYSNKPLGAALFFIVKNSEHGNRLANFLNSKFVTKLLNSVDRPGQRINIDIIIRLPKTILNTDDPLRNVFGLTNEEIEYIES